MNHPIRLFISLIFGVGLYYGLHAHSQKTQQITACAGCFLIGALFIYIATSWFKKGKIVRISGPLYERINNPVEFWFYIVLFSITGICAIGASIYYLFHLGLI
jgi:hypothetical protein